MKRGKRVPSRMSRSMWFRGLLVAVPCTLASAAPAAAQAVPPAPTAGTTPGIVLGVEINATAAELDARAIRSAITSELDVPVTDATTQWPALGVVAVTLDRHALRIVYRRTNGTSIERTVTLPDAPAERVQLITFIATNLVRDQASEILAQLARRPARSVAVAEPVRIDKPVPEAPPAYDLIASIGLVPPLQLDRLFCDRCVVGAGLYAVMGMQDGSRYLTISGVVDYQRRFASGVQFAGAVAVTPRVDGVQLAGAASVGGQVHGVQVAGATSVARRIDGVQFAGAASIADEVHGVQIAAINVAAHLHGVQIGAINISDGNDDAVPIGVINIARHGRTELETSVDSSEMATLTVRHGPRYVQNVLGVGWIQGLDKAMFGVGLGAHQAFPTSPIAFSLDEDAVLWTPLGWGGNDLILLPQLRITVAVPVGPIDLIGGVLGDAYITNGTGAVEDLHPHLDHTYTSGATKVTLWPAGFLGVRLRT